MSTNEPEKRPTYVTCQCNHCAGKIEFDANGLAEENSIMPCPHCGLETKLFIPQPTPGTGAAEKERDFPAFVDLLLQDQAERRRKGNIVARDAKSASAADHLKIACTNCGKRIKFPREQLGQVIDCPGCGLSVVLNVASINLGAATKTKSPSLPPVHPVSRPPVRQQPVNPNLQACPVCKAQISREADICPHCGHPNKRGLMPGQRAKSSGVSRGVGIGCLGVCCVFIWLIVISNFVGDGKTGVRSADPAPYPTDPATQEKLKVGILQYTASGVFTDVKVYDGDQAWVYVSDRFSNLPIGEKEMTVAAIYSVLNRQNSVKFVVLYDANTGKSVGTYHPSIGLKMD